MDNSFDTLTTYLTAWTRRRRGRDALVWLPRGLLAGLLLALGLALVARLRPFLTNQELIPISLLLAGFGLLISLIILLAQQSDLLTQARFADRQFNLQERVRTAVDLHQERVTAPPQLRQHQLADTLTAMQQIDLKTALPLKLIGRDWLIIGLTIILLGTAVYLPNPQEEILLHNRAIEQTIVEQIEALEELKEEIEENPDISDDLRQELLAPIQSALDRLEGDISQEEAMAALSQAEIELRDLAQANNLDNLQQALANSGQNTANDSLAAALQQDSLGETGTSLTQLADQLPTLSAEQLGNLASDLAQTAANLETIAPDLAQQLATAAAAIEAGDLAAAQQALNEAAASLQELDQQASAAQQAASAADQLSQGGQDVAQAGTDGAEAGEATNGSQAGQNGANGTEAGQNGAGEGDGNGPGDGSGQNGSPSALTPGNQAGAGGLGEGGGPANDLFVPDWGDLSQFEGIDIELPAECYLNPLLCGDLLSEWPSELRPQGSQVPYTDVYGNYRAAANQALEEDYIPLGMRGFIRDYFSSLEP